MIAFLSGTQNDQVLLISQAPVSQKRFSDEFWDGKSKARLAISIEFTRRSADPIRNHVSLPSFFY